MVLVQLVVSTAIKICDPKVAEEVVMGDQVEET
jgi:hypothetical protein